MATVVPDDEVGGRDRSCSFSDFALVSSKREKHVIQTPLFPGKPRLMSMRTCKQGVER